MNLAAWRGHRNVFPVVDACGNRFLQRIHRTLQRLITIFSKCRQFRKIRRRNKYSPTILSKFNRITKHIEPFAKFPRQRELETGQAGRG